MLLGKEDQNHLPVHEQLLRYAERLAFVQNLLFVLLPGGLVFTL